MLPANSSYLLAIMLIALGLAQVQTDSTDKLKDLIRSPGYIEIKIVEAAVPDLDPLPMQGDSDVFVRVYLNDTKELVCESQIAQDENKPKVSFVCLQCTLLLCASAA